MMEIGMAWAGRKRKAGIRRPNGRLVSDMQVIPDEVLARRREIAGCEDGGRDHRAGIPLGVLLLRGIITDRQYQAGLRFEGVQAAWAAMAGLPARYPQVTDGGARPDPESDRWQRAAERYRQSLAALGACSARDLVRGVVDMVAVEKVLPPQWLDGHGAHRAKQALRDGLDALAALYRLPLDEGQVA